MRKKASVYRARPQIEPKSFINRVNTAKVLKAEMRSGALCQRVCTRVVEDMGKVLDLVT